MESKEEGIIQIERGLFSHIPEEEEDSKMRIFINRRRSWITQATLQLLISLSQSTYNQHNNGCRCTILASSLSPIRNSLRATIHPIHRSNNNFFGLSPTQM